MIEIVFSPTGGTKKVAMCPEGARSIAPVMKFLVKAALKIPCAKRKPNELFL